MDLREKIIFFSVILSIFTGLQLLVYFTLRKFLKRRYFKEEKRGRIWHTYIPLIPFLLFNIPYYIFLILKFDMTALPKWIHDYYIIPFFIFQGGVFFIAVYLLAGKIIKLPFIISKWAIIKSSLLKEKYDRIRNNKQVVKFDESRRKFITGAAAAVSAYAFIGAGVGTIRKDDFEIINEKIIIPNLPEAFKGKKLVLISDIHSGPYMDTEQMKDYVNVINGLNADIIAIPGDFTNSNKTEVVGFEKAFRDLKSKYGIYGTLGNHDYFSDAEYVAEGVSSGTPIRLLRNESEILEINGSRIAIMGTEDTRDSGVSFNKVFFDYFDKADKDLEMKLDGEARIKAEIPKIFLCHKPYPFDAAAERGIDLMLSGHTHGGQIVFAKFGNINLSFAASVSNYVSGLYKKGNSQMYVSRGIGTVGLPIRLNCPPEITVMELG